MANGANGYANGSNECVNDANGCANESLVPPLAQKGDGVMRGVPGSIPGAAPSVLVSLSDHNSGNLENALPRPTNALTGHFVVRLGMLTKHTKWGNSGVK